MATSTSTLPGELLQSLAEKAKSLGLPKTRLMENALKLYLEHLERAEYARSYKQAADKQELPGIAEEGLSDYLKQLK